jgi:hypothetical protein
MDHVMFSLCLLNLSFRSSLISLVCVRACMHACMVLINICLEGPFKRDLLIN